MLFSFVFCREKARCIAGGSPANRTVFTAFVAELVCLATDQCRKIDALNPCLWINDSLCKLIPRYTGGLVVFTSEQAIPISTITSTMIDGSRIILAKVGRGLRDTFRLELSSLKERHW